jgi:predicted transposase YbfD/YdcC
VTPQGRRRRRSQGCPADRCSFDTRYFICSAPLDIERIANATRGHWGVESMHWLLDVEFGDDLSRYRAGHGAENMAVVRRFALVRANKVKRKRQDAQKAGKLESRLPARNPPARMTVNLDSAPSA